MYLTCNAIQKNVELILYLSTGDFYVMNDIFGLESSLVLVVVSDDQLCDLLVVGIHV